MIVENKTIEALEKSAMKMSLTVTGETTQRFYDESLQKYLKDAQIPGFRKGKVPRSLFIRKFDEGIRQEALSQIIEKAVEEACTDLEKKPISLPFMEELPNLDPGKPCNLTVTYDVFPELALGEYKGIEIEEPQVKILEEHVNATLEDIRERNALVVDKEDGCIASDSVVTMDYVELSQSDEPLEETRRDAHVFTVGGNAHPYEIDDDIIGMKTGEVKIIEKSYGEKAPSHLAGKTLRLEVTIKAVKERQLPALDDELAQDISDELNTLDDLKKKVREDLESNLEKQIIAKNIYSAQSVILERSTLVLPESMISSELESEWKKFVSEHGNKEAEILATLKKHGRSKQSLLDEWREGAVRKITWSIIAETILELENFQITEENLKDEIDRRMKTSDHPVYVEELLENPRMREYFRFEMMNEKINEILLEASNIKKGEEMNLNDFLISQAG